MVARLRCKFLGLRDVSLESFPCLGNAGDKELGLAALAAYAVFRATNHSRGQAALVAQKCSDALEHWCKIGAQGHTNLTRAFDRRWQRHGLPR